MIDSKGEGTVKYTYDSWGKVEDIAGSMAETLGRRNPFRYRGYYYDTETGMYYLKSRYYDPEMRRFISPDTVISGPQDGANLFAYCENNPVNMVDYNGHLALGIGLGIAAIGTVILGKIVTSEQVQTSSRNFVDSFSKTIVYGARSAVDYWRRDYRDRVNERMMEKRLEEIKDYLKVMDGAW